MTKKKRWTPEEIVNPMAEVAGQGEPDGQTDDTTFAAESPGIPVATGEEGADQEGSSAPVLEAPEVAEKKSWTVEHFERSPGVWVDRRRKD